MSVLDEELAVELVHEADQEGDVACPRCYALWDDVAGRCPGCDLTIEQVAASIAG